MSTPQIQSDNIAVNMRFAFIEVAKVDKKKIDSGIPPFLFLRPYSVLISRENLTSLFSYFGGFPEQRVNSPVTGH